MTKEALEREARAMRAARKKQSDDDRARDAVIPLLVQVHTAANEVHRCKCGANLFLPDGGKFRCNGCKAVQKGNLK